jgi:hypothetical protein
MLCTTGAVLRLSFHKSAQYDNPDEGAGYRLDGTEDFRSWAIDMSHANGIIWGTTDKLPEVLDAHLTKWGLPTLAEWNTIDEPGRLTTNRDEDENGAEVTDEWHRQGHQLYLCDYDMYLLALPHEHTPEVEELHKLFPMLGRV